MSNDQDQLQQPQTNEQTPAPQGTTQINTLDDFAAVITQWHHIVLKRLEHLQTVPDGIEFTVGEGEVEKLTGDLRKGFLMGLSMATSEISKLPFQSTADDTEPSDPAQGAANDEPATPA